MKKDSESTVELRAKLARLHAGRTLTGTIATVEDQAESVFFLVSERSARTTGQILTVDGGLKDAFLR
jgi:NAD(P)-dependent dehydrogenase (short-subunit alcohol dehydrogenase family)